MKKENFDEFNYIKQIRNSDCLFSMSYEELNGLASDLRNYIIKEVSINGGHLSSNLCVVDATIALFRKFDFRKDIIIFDTGHQTYSYKILSGRNLTNLRKKRSVSGFQKLSESIYDHYECGHTGTAISAAFGMAKARDLKNENNYVISFIGDASIANGIAFEGLNLVGKYDKNFIVVLNDNNMAISKPVGVLSDLFVEDNKDNFFRNLGYEIIGPIDGHNIKQIEDALEKAKQFNGPVLVHLKTVKGKGYAFSEQDNIGYTHGVSPFNIEEGPIKNDRSSWSYVASEAINQAMVDENVYSIVPATALGSNFNSILENYPDRSMDVGIAEEHAFLMAAGLSLKGYHPIISIYSTFLQRCYDQISHDLSRMNLKSTVVIDRAGLVGNDGTSHQGIFDEAMLYTIPNTVITMPTYKEDVKKLIDLSINQNKDKVYTIRIPRCECTHSHANNEIQFGKWNLEIEGKDVLVISLGPVVAELKSPLLLCNKSVALVNAYFQKPLDINFLKGCLDYQKIIIYHPYATENGFANEVIKTLTLLGYKNKIIVKAIPSGYIEHASISEQIDDLSLNVNDLLKLI